jgi:hypothetical protein
MAYNDWVGTIGVLMILLAYFANSFGFIRRQGKLYFILNIAGASLACYASVLIRYIPFMVLEGMWTLVSIAAFIKLLQKDDGATE